MKKPLLNKIIVSFVLFFITGKVLWAENFKKWNIQEPSLFIKEVKPSRNFYWIATAGGLLQLDRSLRKSKTYTKSNGLPDNYISSVAVEPNEAGVWVGTPEGISRIDVRTGKIVTYTKRNSKLSDNNVNTLCLHRDEVFIGTSFGVDVFNTKTNSWRAYTAIEGLAGGNIQVILSDGVYIWAAGADGLSYYDPNEDFWDYYGVENGLNSSLITSMSIDFDAVWVGTMGGGLSRFDRETLRFEAYTSDEGLIDDNVQYVMDDGKYIWIGTFGGLSRMDKNTLIFKNFDTGDGLKELSITSGFIDGSEVFTGTDGAGIFVSKKDNPQVNFNFAGSGYTKKGQIGIIASINSGKGIKNVDVQYKLVAKADEFDYTPVRTVEKWKNLKPGSQKEGFEFNLLEWDTSELPDGKYLVSISVKDDNGNENKSSGIVIVDNKKPEIQLFFRAPSAGANVAMVSGSYQELNLTGLEVSIGNRKVIPSINRQTRRFRFEYPLSSQDKIKVTATDLGHNTVTIEREFVIDQNPPVLTLDPVDTDKITGNLAVITGTVEDENIDKVIILPDQVEAELRPIGGNKYRFEAKASIKKEGIYTYQINATDKGGKSTVQSLEVNFFSKITIVEIRNDLIPEFTLKEKISITGNILGPPLKEFYVIHRDTEEKIPVTVKSDKSFIAEIPLKRGKNNIVVIKVYEDGRKESDAYLIESSSGEVSASLDPYSTSFTKSEATLSGIFDRGITKVLVNSVAAEMDFEARTFRVPVVLRTGKNRLTLSWVDELGRVGRKQIEVFLDNEPPLLYVRRLPEKTGLQTLRIKGRAVDNTSFEVVGYPNVEITEVNPETGEFSAVVQLDEGINNIQFFVKDTAGNRVTRIFTVEYNKKYPKVEVPEDALLEEVEMLRAEVDRLRKALENRPVVQRPSGGFQARSLPSTPGLYWVPMAGKIRSYALTAKIYLGNENLGNLVAAYNGQDPRTLKRVLVPTPALFALISDSMYRPTFERLIEIAGQAYSAGAGRLEVEKRLLRYMVRSGTLREVKEYKGYSVFITKSGAAVVVAAPGVKIPRRIKDDAGANELLIIQISSKGLTFDFY